MRFCKGFFLVRDIASLSLHYSLVFYFIFPKHYNYKIFPKTYYYCYVLNTFNKKDS